jgi:diphthine synthase
MSNEQLIFIGLGLYDEKDVSLNGMNELKNCDRIFAEFYTSKLIGMDINAFEKRIGKPIEVLSREETEQGNILLNAAEGERVCFLICGDPMIATTHIDLRLRAIKRGIPTRIIHNGSIITAAPALLGLQNYKFGRTTTIAFPEKEYFPTSPYLIIKKNKDIGLHTLILLDIQADKNVYMTANQAMDLLLKMEEQYKENVIAKDDVICIVTCAGAPDAGVYADAIGSLLNKDFGPPLHTLIIPGNLHFMELEALEILAHLPKSISKKIQKL